MKNILVPVELHSSLDSVLDTALLVAERFESYVEGMPLGPDLPDLVAFDMPVSWTVADQNTWREMADEDRRRFEAYMAARSVPPHGPASSGLSWGWAGESSLGDSQVGSYGRIFDVTVLGRPSSERGGPRMATAEAALFESGRPVLLAPPSGYRKATLGDTIVIAWNQSMETARATRGAHLMMLRAKKVYVLTIKEWIVDGPTGEQMAERLRNHGIPAEAVSRSGRGSQGEAILEHAASLGADLLIKGAYTSSRLRQMIFGGATSHILAKATLPVLMAT
ncbi:MAG TPA: universal stress protein [Beijerinckiaceae bacterium]|nr:universal stress protein [Beijerinckiaceae bacterium]